MRIHQKSQIYLQSLSEQLREFRQLADQCLGQAKDATFELADAVMTTRHIWCLGEFSSQSLISASVVECL